MRTMPAVCAEVEADVTDRRFPVNPVVAVEATAMPVPDVTPLALTVTAVPVVAVFELMVSPAVPVLMIVPLEVVVLPRVSALAKASVPIPSEKPF